MIKFKLSETDLVDVMGIKKTKRKEPKLLRFNYPKGMSIINTHCRLR
jgi:hypothetical protein